MATPTSSHWQVQKSKAAALAAQIAQRLARQSQLPKLVPSV